MIKHLSPGSSRLHINHNGGDLLDMYPTLPSTGGHGMMRWNPTSNGIEVWNGSSWTNVTSSAEISLSPETEELLDWATKQKNKFERLERLSANNVTLQDALDRYKKAEEALHIVEALCDTSNSGDSHT